VYNRREDIRSFLRTLRLRLDPDARTLGSFERLGSRKGRRVTQEEVAEAAGISRGWYALLESGAPVQASISLLDRLAVALNATAHERAMLFSLAIPELNTTVLWSMET
jgi:DNA-binding XRE family transcriptional regulator